MKTYGDEGYWAYRDSTYDYDNPEPDYDDDFCLEDDKEVLLQWLKSR